MHTAEIAAAPRPAKPGDVVVYVRPLDGASILRLVEVMHPRSPAEVHQLDRLPRPHQREPAGFRNEGARPGRDANARPVRTGCGFGSSAKRCAPGQTRGSPVVENDSSCSTPWAHQVRS
jgi:hypothetical protein